MLTQAELFVRSQLAKAESGHDFFHIQRVTKLALTIAQSEIDLGKQINLTIVQLGALFHDIADHKFNNGDENIGPKIAREFLKSIGTEASIIQAVEDIIRTISFKGANVDTKLNSIEAAIVQDADRLDALGAIGIARAFTYGGYKNRVLYDPDQQAIKHDNFEDYKKNQSTTINHFYEKLFLLKDRMNTESGKKLATKRHKIMEEFVEQFKLEWEGQQ